MRNLSFVAIVFCALVTLISCNQKPGAAASTTPAVAGKAAAGASNVVYVNIDSLLAGYNLYKDQKLSMEGQAAAAEKGIAAKIEAFQKRSARFQQAVYETQQKAQTIPPVELQALQQKFEAQQASLQNEEQALMKQRDEAALVLDKKLNELQVKLKSNIDTHLEKVAAEKGYDFVLIKGSAGGVLFGKKELDITKDVLTVINADYAATKGK
jgi:outer membrane protein